MKPATQNADVLRRDSNLALARIGRGSRYYAWFRVIRRQGIDEAITQRGVHPRGNSSVLRH
jgi:hypothetical protein